MLFIVFTQIVLQQPGWLAPVQIPQAWAAENKVLKPTLNIKYFTAESGPLLFEEPAEQVIWLGHSAYLILGSTGFALPEDLLSRSRVYVEIWDGLNLVNSLDLNLSLSRFKTAEQGSGGGAANPMESRYLAQLSNYLVGNTPNFDIWGSQFVLDNMGPALISQDGTSLSIFGGTRIGLQIVGNHISPNLFGGYEGNNAWSGVHGATICGGGTSDQTNIITDHYCTIGGGKNQSAGNYDGNFSNAGYITIGGGESNSVYFEFGTISGGKDNEVASAFGTISGGENNGAAGEHSSVGGGTENDADSRFGSIGGGQGNTTEGIAAVVSGGSQNQAQEHYSSILGGLQNTTNGEYASILGGWNNAATGYYSAVFGGENCLAQNNYSYAWGRRAKSVHTGSVVYGDDSNSDISSTGTNQFIVRAKGGFWFGTDSSPSIPTGRFLNTSTGAYLSSGGTWTNNSDRNQKTNLVRVDASEILGKVMDLPVYQYEYLEELNVRHLGPMAQDFSQTFGLGQNETQIATIDSDGVALAAIQALGKLVLEQQKEIEALKQLLTQD